MHHVLHHSFHLLAESGQQDDWKKPQQYSPSSKEPLRADAIRILLKLKNEASHLTGNVGGINNQPFQGSFGESIQHKDSRNTQVVHVRSFNDFENNKKIPRKVHGELFHLETNIFNCPVHSFSWIPQKTEDTCIKWRLGPKASPRTPPKYSHRAKLDSQETADFFVQVGFFQAVWRAWSSLSRSALLTKLGGPSSI